MYNTEPIMPPPMPSGPPKAANSGSDLTAVMKNPSKVVLLRVSVKHAMTLACAGA